MMQPGPVMVGRTVERAALTALLDDAVTGRGRCVVLAGEAGAGKTVLVDDAITAARDRGLTVLAAQCVDLGDPGLPFLAVRDLVQALRAVAEHSSAATAALEQYPMAAALADGSGDQVSRIQVLDGVAAALAAAAAGGGPLLIVVEDVQWLDPSSAEFLRFLLSRLRDQRLAVLLSQRVEPAVRPAPSAISVRRQLGELARLPAVTRIDLQPFGLDEVRSVLASVLDRPVDTAFAAAVLRRTEGNPFYVRALAEAKGEIGSGELPSALVDVLRQRLEPLAPDARLLLDVLAIAGRPARHPELRALTGLADDRALAAARDAIADGVLRTDSDRYAFSHALLAEAVLADLLPAERAALHGRIAEALAAAVPATGPTGSAARADRRGSASAAEVAYHFDAAGELGEALRWSVRAADEAELLIAPAEAGRHLTRALELWTSSSDAVRRSVSGSEIARRAANQAALAGEPQDALRLAETAVELATADAAGSASLPLRLARSGLARQLLDIDRPDEALEQALLAIGADTPPLVPARIVAARVLVELGDYDTARRHAEIATAQLGPAVDVELVLTLALLDETAGDHRGAAARRQGGLDRAMAAHDQLAEQRLRWAIASHTFYLGDPATAVPLIDDAVDRSAESGLRWSQAGVELRALQVVAHYLRGDLAGSVAAAERGTGEPPDVPAARLAALACYAEVARGDPDVAERFTSLRGLWGTDPQVGIVAGGCEADALNWSGHPSAAQEMADRTLTHLDTTLGPGAYAGFWLCTLGLAALADLAAEARLRRQPQVVAAAVERGAELRRRVEELDVGGHGRPGSIGPEGIAWRDRARAEHARLTGAPDAVPAWELVVASFGDWYPYERARSQWRLAEVLVGAGHAQAAAEPARAAWQTAEQMGAKPLRDAVELLARRSRLDIGVHRSAAAVLTDRELEVLELVAAGRTNRQIGQLLFISDKTVSVHVSNAMSKLGAVSRTDAAVLAHRRGLLALTDPQRSDEAG